jgi:dTDP-4-amino-4,6-dideoxygalactose transaminase
MKNYKLIDLKREYNFLKNKINSEVQRVFEEGSFTLGKELKNFEDNFARYCNKKFCVGTSSGTTAIFFALKSIGVNEGDEIIVPTLTFTATAEAIVQAGAKPVFVDVDQNTLLINTEKIEEKITKKTKAIIPVHLYGLTCDMNRILSIGKKHDLKVIEDCCQAHGATYKGMSVPIGETGCFSFMAAKNLNTCGDGGCIVTNNKKIYDSSMLLRNHGRKSKNDHVIIGYSGRLDNLKASILNIKLKYLNDWNKKRRRIGELYKKNLNKKLVTFQEIPKERESSYCYFIIKIKKNRDRILADLKKEGIEAAIHYPKPLHLQKAYLDLMYKRGDFPNAEKACKELVSLPIHPFLRDSEVKSISNKINFILEKHLQK